MSNPKKNRDPYCGTGRLFITAYKEITKKNLDREANQFLKFQTFKGWEISPELNRLGLMNCILNNISDISSKHFVYRQDALSSSSSGNI
ncbi:MAG: N-6 DNA methylase [Saprospiraceae bacterium]|nr:N-6 DNA methylase [Saprospiraceae bacterium]